MIKFVKKSVIQYDIKADLIGSYMFERMFNLRLTPETKRLEMKKGIKKHDMRYRFKFYKFKLLGNTIIQ